MFLSLRVGGGLRYPKNTRATTALAVSLITFHRFIHRLWINLWIIF